MEGVGDDDEVVFGAGRIEDFSWKQLLDMATCTECGRCQSQCPAWNTGKPLSPKLLIMDLRDNLFASAERVMAKNRAAGVEVDTLVPSVIDPDVLWSCTTCGACVEQCPVDIEHIDTIIDMRRYEVLMESRFPTEAGLMLRNIENQGDPWGLGLLQAHRLDRRPRLRGAGGQRHHPRRHRVPLLGGLCRLARRAGPQGNPGHRPHAPPGRGLLRHPRAEGELHR